MEKIIEFLEQNINNLFKIVLSETKSKEFLVKKVIIRKILLKNGIKWQIEEFKLNQVFHNNINAAELIEYVKQSLKNYCQCSCFADDFCYNFYYKGLKIKLKKVPVKNANINLSHNHEKKYLIEEGMPIDIFVELGIFNKDYSIKKSSMDKFIQINKFIENMDDIIKHWNNEEIKIVDFGCGKSYLSFFLFHYLTKIKNIKTTMIGYDLKDEVIKNCNNLANKYNYSGLSFKCEDVSKTQIDADILIVLHACDTATDYALYNAIKNKISHIVCVPCCQHEINASIKGNGDFNLILKDGLIKERFSALLTDAIRIEVLRKSGYNVDVLEFMDMIHSPKNLMIRAKKVKNCNFDLEDINQLRKKYNFNQSLAELLK